ncbi:hypothetical protein DFS34DRAFT_437262 [Phlyctochytrium arcticum]|nr:hypothetical protein DFS34DRAFT_437262 [Phlyctochytrium arcticum]
MAEEKNGKRSSVDDESSAKRLKTGAEKSSSDLLLEWATENGADVKNLLIVESEDQDELHRTRTVFAKVCIPANENIALIPPQLVMSEETAEASIVGQVLKKHFAQHPESLKTLSQDNRDPYAPGLVILSAFIVHEKFENEGSFWSPYLNVLPKSYDLPIWWSDDELKLLSGTNLLHTVSERRKVLERGFSLLQDVCANLFPSGSLTWTNFLWAYSAISSRAFPKTKAIVSSTHLQHDAALELAEIAEGKTVLCMYPILDMLNHRRAQPIEWRIDSTKGVAFVSQVAIENYSELFNNYGAKGNENLLGNYGFVLEENPEDYVKIALNLRKEDPLDQLKRKRLTETSLYKLVHLLFAGKDDMVFPQDLLAVTRVLVMNESELRSECDPRSAIGPRNEFAALTTLWSLMDQKWKDIRKFHILRTSNFKGRMARTYRDGQEIILRHNIELCQKMLLEYQCSFSNQPVVSIALSDNLPVILGHRLSQSILHAKSSILSKEFTNAMTSFSRIYRSALADDEQDDPDEDTIICLALAFERQRGSQWKQALGQPLDSSAVASILGEGQADIIEHFDGSVHPILQHAGEEWEAIKAEGFLWAAAILEKYSIQIPGNVQQAMQIDFGEIAVVSPFEV